MGMESPTTVAALELRDVGHTFLSNNGEAIDVLDGIDLEIGPNEFVVILGLSGCGKTTLLRIIDGLITPTRGTIAAAGAPILGPSAERAMVFQEADLLPWRTALENAAFGLEVQGVPRRVRRERAREQLRRVGLHGFDDHFPFQLSGGMRQRVGIARALATEPRMLLMDEPFGALDAQTREDMQDQLLRLWEEDQKVVVFITHDIDEAILLADRVIVLSNRPGRIALTMPIELERPRAGRDLRTDAQFVGYRSQIQTLLKDMRVELAQREMAA